MKHKIEDVRSFHLHKKDNQMLINNLGKVVNNFNIPE